MSMANLLAVRGQLHNVVRAEEFLSGTIDTTKYIRKDLDSAFEGKLRAALVAASDPRLDGVEALHHVSLARSAPDVGLARTHAAEALIHLDGVIASNLGPLIKLADQAVVNVLDTVPTHPRSAANMLRLLDSEVTRPLAQHVAARSSSAGSLDGELAAAVLTERSMAAKEVARTSPSMDVDELALATRESAEHLLTAVRSLPIQ